MTSVRGVVALLSWTRIRSLVAWLVVLAGGCAIAVALYVAFQLWDHGRSASPDNLGNTRAAALLPLRPTQSNVLKFAIIGDINNRPRTFEAVVRRLKEEKDVDLLVLLGDCVSRQELSLHQYFISEFAETCLTIPTFVVAGNHDVKAGMFFYDGFEQLYGPANFSFVSHDCLFIGLGGIHSDQKQLETLSFLEATLATQRARAKKVFVFMHYLPKASEDIPTDGMTYEKEFQNLFEKYRVSYVFGGHYHRLARTEVNGVVYLVTGGGGARLEKDRFGDIGLFHHLTLIKVRDNSVCEHVIPIHAASQSDRFLEKIERLGITWALPCVEHHMMTSAVLAAAVVVLCAWGVTDRIRSLLRFRRPPRPVAP